MRVCPDPARGVDPSNVSRRHSPTGSRSRPLRVPPWCWALAAGAAGLVVFLSLPRGGVGQALTLVGSVAASAAVLALGPRASLGREGRAWRLIALGTAALATGIAIWWSYPLLRHSERPALSVADAMFAVAGVSAMAGMWILARTGTRARDALLMVDTVILTVVGGVGVGWIAVTHRGATAVRAWPRLALIAYALCVIALLGFAVRLATQRGKHAPSARLLALGMGILAVDVALYSAAMQAGTYRPGGLLDGLVIPFAAVLAAAALHPSAVKPARPQRSSATAWRGIWLSGIVLLIPALLHFSHVEYGVFGEDVVEAGEVALVLLVMIRMGILVRLLDNSRRELEVRGQELGRAVGNLERLRDRLRYESLHDHLTGLANRTCFERNVRSALGAEAGRAAVLFLDLDGFKDVNDDLGHHGGDEILRHVSARLAAGVRQRDLVARLGGDEFGVLLRAVRDPHEPMAVAERIIASLGDPVRVGVVPVRVGVSVGIAFIDPGSDSVDAVMRRADAAMYAAKTAGGGRFRLFGEHMLDDGSGGIDLTELERALERGEFVVHYQPIVDLGRGSIAAVEALVRWEHPERGLLLPGYFVPRAERSDAIVRIGSTVLRSACRQVREWQEAGVAPTPFAVSVNVSARQVERLGFAAEVAGILRETGLPPEALVLELTESAFVTDTESARATLEALRETGVRIALDDFGTGYSSMGYLKRFPVDLIKLDRSLLDEVDGGSGRLVRAVCSLVRTLGIEPIAEGVERAEQLLDLAAMGCRLVQGFHLSHPLPAAETEALLRDPGAMLRRATLLAKPSPVGDRSPGRSDPDGDLATRILDMVSSR